MWRLGDDDELIRHDQRQHRVRLPRRRPATIRRAVESAVEHGVSMEHPVDLQGFGRRSMRLTATEVRDAVLYQAAAIQGVAHACGGSLRHVKLHGALYNDAARDAETAAGAVEAVSSLDPSLLLYAPPGSETTRLGRKAGLRVIAEGFADRRAGQIAPEPPRPGSLITDPAAAAAQALLLAASGRVVAHDGEEIPLRADTICVHGDNPSALEIVRAVRQTLESAGVVVRRLE
ncbi:MAG: 5-oxoprolinase subunit PxpA [Chloroflexia bacterium]